MVADPTRVPLTVTVLVAPDTDEPRAMFVVEPDAPAVPMLMALVLPVAVAFVAKLKVAALVGVPPMLSVVAAPPIFSVVAVVLKRSKDALLVTSEVTKVGLVLKTSLSEPVSSLITPAN